MNNEILDLAKILKGLPNMTQVAIGLIKNGSENYFGLVKEFTCGVCVLITILDFTIERLG